MNYQAFYKTIPYITTEASLVAQMAKNLPTVWETWVQFLGREDPLEKRMATHSSTLALKFPWMEETGRLQSMELLESDTTERLHFHFSLSCIGEGKATDSNVLAWRIPGMGRPGGLPSVGWHRVRHD